MLRHFSSALPKYFQVRKLGWPKSKVTLVGLKRRQDLHSSYLRDLLKFYAPQCIVTQLAPDLPYFIKTKVNIKTTWDNFMKTGNADFLVKPWPEILTDVTLSQDKLANLSQMMINSPDYFYMGLGPVCTYCPQLEDTVIEKEIKTLQTDNFFEPIVWASNNITASKCVMLGDMPDLIYRDQIVRHPWSIQEFRKMFDTFIEETLEGNDHFDIRFLDKQVFIDPKATYIAEVVKQACMSFPNVLAVVEYDLLEFIEAAWIDLQAEPQTLKRTLPKITGNVPFVDTVEKHVLLDLMFEPLLHDWYIQNKFYPYTGVGSLAGNSDYCLSALEAWTYFTDKHKKMVLTLLENRPKAGRKFKRVRRQTS
mmetsp:Transcript_18666/g.33752  ORF Transcript_18666/g.33752 Transcript_18666/m.33752 type:complete len:364 (+) Transcript_18666:287-1378(+)